jgi:predicted nucleotidyltransferase
MPAPPLPEPVASVASELAGLPGVTSVVLGGSRANDTHRPDSDWDLGVYYRGALDPGDVRRLGHSGYVSELGEWGPIMNGGAWLTVEDTPIDVLFRDLDVVERWLADAERGRFEVLVQNGYVVGAPTYVPVGELAINLLLSGELPRPEYPEPLAAAAAERWHGRAGVSLMFAEIHAAAGDATACAGMLADAVLSAGHARLAERHQWALNEKRLVERAGLTEVQPLLAEPGATSAELAATVAAVAGALGVPPLSAR